MEQCSEDSLLYYFGDFPPERVENTFKNWKKKKRIGIFLKWVITGDKIISLRNN